MLELLPVLTPIVLVDIINPVLLAAVIYALGSRRPILLSKMILFGWLVVYFGSGVIIAIGLESIMQFLQNPRPIDFYIEAIIAVLLLWFGIKLLRPSKETKTKKEFGDGNSLNMISAFGIGATINLIGLPFAIPYFAALDQILKANMNWIDSLGVLALYNIIYIAPFGILILIKILFGKAGENILQKINNLMEKAGKVLLPVMMILLAAALLIDAILYFGTGKPWF